MSISQQLVKPLRSTRHTWSSPVLRSARVTSYTTYAIAQRTVKGWRSRLPSGGCIYSNIHTYSSNSSWTWDWTQLLQAPPKAKSKRRRWKLPKPDGDDVVVWVIQLRCSLLFGQGFVLHKILSSPS
jgi:hypothetical protein